MNIQERIEALETEFNEKIKALKAEAQQVDEFPRDGDIYWYIGLFGAILCGNWVGDAAGTHLLTVGNVYKTDQEAVFALEKLKVEAELRKYSTPFKEDENNCFIQINSSYNNIVIDTDEGYQTQGTIYYETRKEALLAIDTVGEDRIKKYIFGVED